MMKKVVKKLLSVIVLSAIILSTLSIISFAADEYNIADAAANVKIELSDKSVTQGDTITVYVNVTTNYPVPLLQVPVIYDKTQFEVVDFDKDNATLNFNEDSDFANGSYKFSANSGLTKGFECTSNGAVWNTDAAREQFDYVWITIMFDSSINPENQTLVIPSDELIASFKLKAKSDIDDTSETVFVSEDWVKSTKNKSGLFSIGFSPLAVNSNPLTFVSYGIEYTTETVVKAVQVYEVLTDLRIIRGTASLDGATVTITKGEGKNVTGVYTKTRSGNKVEIKDVNGKFDANRTDAYVAYVDKNTANVNGTMVITLADGTAYEYAVIFDLGLVDSEPETPEVPDIDLESELRVIRGTASVDGTTVTITKGEGKNVTGVYTTTRSGYKVEIKDVNGKFDVNRTDAYVAYVDKNTANVEGTMVVTLADGTTYEYAVIFDLGLGEPEPETPEVPDIDLASELRVIRGTASVDGTTVTITKGEGKNVTGVYTTTRSGYKVEIKDVNGKFDANRTDAYVAYVEKNTVNVNGTMVITLADGTTYEYAVIFDLGLGEPEPETPEVPDLDLASELKVIRGTASIDGTTVTITKGEGKNVTGVYAKTRSGYKVEIKDVNGKFDASRTDAYVAYVANNTANVEGTMVVTLADGTTYEYAVIFDLGL